MQRTKSLAMAVVGPRHQLGKTIGLVAVFPQHSQGQSHTRCHSSSTAGHSSPPGRGSAPSPPLLRTAEAGRAQVPPFSARPAKVVVPQDRVKTMAEEPRLAERRGHTATDSGLGLSSGECTPLSPGMQPRVFRPQAHALPAPNKVSLH